MRVPVPDLRGRTCLITGAASGIGRATAIAAAQRGARLVLTDVAPLDDVTRRLDGAVVLSRELDLTDVEAVRQLAEDAGRVDVAMNIAGISTWGSVDRLSHEQWRRTVDVDLMGPIHVIEAFVPPMIEAGTGGHLVNVSSAAGLLGLPWHAPYSAAKFGLRGVSEVLRFDLERHRIGVSLVCPGGVDTGLVQTVDVAGVDLQGSKVQERFRRHAKAPEQVAESILRGVERNRYLVYTSRDIQALHLLERLAPPAYALAMRVANRRFVAELEALRTPEREGAAIR